MFFPKPSMAIRETEKVGEGTPFWFLFQKRVQKLQAAFAFTLIKSSRNQLKKSARIFISRRLD